MIPPPPNNSPKENLEQENERLREMLERSEAEIISVYMRGWPCILAKANDVPGEYVAGLTNGLIVLFAHAGVCGEGKWVHLHGARFVNAANALPLSCRSIANPPGGDVHIPLTSIAWITEGTK